MATSSWAIEEALGYLEERGWETRQSGLKPLAGRLLVHHSTGDG